ncbi:SDR family oxidoreductase [Aggregicoccus sp. 17bor-14]|uniref:SDR family oxidoreductase n=1 Tax=Myxococcaceae TaxID=31 RepID=UPI00129CA8A4|nr:MULTISPECIES: SDR family oxidoreductase [Myxococcaceae]MBF5045725.1 SDR family oxidoreductase [Simulacricoccus sp. 17bor-14]MRI91461.1 SDR family oxidoreductase [Aggregicoccus sp. 17bor-14]
MNLNARHVVVIGGSSGIGLGIARAALGAGARVTLCGRSEERLASAARDLDAPARVATFAADATHEEAVRRLFETAGPVDHVVTTTVHVEAQGVHQLDLAAAQRVLDSKLGVALRVAKHARLQAGGSLLFVTGVASDRPGPSGAVVAAANGALHSLTRALALELAPVRVNALSPGWVETPLWDRLATPAARDERFAQQAQRLPARRIGTTADLGHAALFLLSNGFTTGEVLSVDGGHRLV